MPDFKRRPKFTVETSGPEGEEPFNPTSGPGSRLLEWMERDAKQEAEIRERNRDLTAEQDLTEEIDQAALIAAFKENRDLFYGELSALLVQQTAMQSVLPELGQLLGELIGASVKLDNRPAENLIKKAFETRLLEKLLGMIGLDEKSQSAVLTNYIRREWGPITRSETLIKNDIPQSRPEREVRPRARSEGGEPRSAGQRASEGDKPRPNPLRRGGFSPFGQIG